MIGIILLISGNSLFNFEHMIFQNYLGPYLYGSIKCHMTAFIQLEHGIISIDLYKRKTFVNLRGKFQVPYYRLIKIDWILPFLSLKMFC
jgi:hypothetical protein